MIQQLNYYKVAYFFILAFMYYKLSGISLLIVTSMLYYNIYVERNDKVLIVLIVFSYVSNVIITSLLKYTAFYIVFIALAPYAKLIVFCSILLAVGFETKGLGYIAFLAYNYLGLYALVSTIAIKELYIALYKYVKTSL